MKIYIGRMIIFLLIALPLCAEVDERKSDIYFANGINTIKKDANKHLRLIYDAVVESAYYNDDLKMAEDLHFDLAYNQTKGFVNDIYEALLQKKDAEWNWWIFYEATKAALSKLAGPLSKGVDAAVKLGETMTQAVHDADLSLQVENYHKSIKAGHGVIAIAHSQGNLFTNEAYGKLDEWMKPFFRTIALASPAHNVAGDYPHITFDNDVITAVPTSLTGAEENPVRNTTWYPAYENETSTPPYSSPMYTWKSQAPTSEVAGWIPYDSLDVNFHDFRYYMGKLSLAGYYGNTLSTQNVRHQILDLIDLYITSHNTGFSQWTLKNENETTSICEERRAELVHFKDAVAPIPVAFPFNADGKVYQLPSEDENTSMHYVKGSAEGTKILDIQTGEDNKCYELKGTGEQIEINNPCADLNVTDGVITVDLTWDNPQIDMELSVTKDDALVGTMEFEDSQECAREYLYIPKSQIEEGKYYINIGSPAATDVDSALLPENIRFNIDTRAGGVDITLPIANADLLNMGQVAYVLITVSKNNPENNEDDSYGVSFGMFKDLPYTIETYIYTPSGEKYNYDTVVLLNRVELGPIANAYLEIMALTEEEKGNIVYTGYTSSGDTLETNGLMSLGSTFKQSLTDNALYLISATGGEDIDADDNLVWDATSTTNYGTVHAIVSGKSLKENGIKVNVMTEIGYQVTKDLLADANTSDVIIARLDDAAHALFTNDINYDNSIDHLDLHAWIPSFDKKKLRMSYDSVINPIVQKIYNADDIYQDAYNLVYPVYAPVANAGPDQTITEVSTITLDGSNSYDSDGQIVKYRWSSGGTLYCQGSDPVCVVENLAVGDYLFQLSVTDDEGLWGYDKMKIAYPYKPVADAGADQSAKVGESVLLDGSGSYDLDGNIVQYQWSKGDKVYCSKSTPSCSIDGLVAGVHNIILRVTDNLGMISTDSIKVAMSSKAALIGTLDLIASNLAVSADGNFMYVATNSGITILDSTNPANPVFISDYATPGGVTSIVMSPNGNTAYITMGGWGLHIVDISNPALPLFAGSYEATDSTGGIALSEDGNFAYMADGDAGISILDVSDPTSPQLSGNYLTSDYVETVTLSPDGKLLYIANAFDGVIVLNVNDPASPYVMGSISTTAYVAHISVSNDGLVGYVSDYKNGVQIINLSNPSDLFKLSNYNAGSYAMESALSKDGTRLYVASGNLGIIILDVSDPQSPLLIGSFITNGYAQHIALSADEDVAYVSEFGHAIEIIDISMY